VELDHLVVRRVEPRLALRRRERLRDAVRPPLPVGARVAVPEADELLSLVGDEEDEVGAGGVPGEALARPLVRERADTES